MRIGIDGRELCGRPTGVGRHLAGLIHAWSAMPKTGAHTFVLFAHDGPVMALPPWVDVRVLPGAGGTVWEQTTLGKAANKSDLDVFFAPGYTAPLRLAMPNVLLVHDLSFVRHPEWFRPREGLRRRLLTKWAAARAALVLTVSETARADVLDAFALPAHRVRCVYPGISVLADDTSPRGREQVHARGEPLVLFAGSIFNRRHVPDLIEAFARVHRRHPDSRLEIVGENRTHPRQELASIAAAEGLQDVVAVRSYVPDDTLAGLYARAGAFAFLSEYEGFGHPPLEALSRGVPALLLDTPVAREVCLDAAIYVSGQVGAIADALEALLFDETARARVLRAAPGVLARYSWTNAAQQTLDALETAAGATR